MICIRTQLGELVKRVSAARTCWLVIALAAFLLVASASWAQLYSLPPNGDFGGTGPFNVAIDAFVNPNYPTANGQILTVSVYHANSVINTSFPTIFFAHGYTSPIGSAGDYSALLSNLASQGYNVVFSPYEGGTSPSIPRRFDELTTGFDAAANLYGLNTTKVGFAGHSYGGGFLPAVIQHEMMGQADQFTAGHTWGATAAFMYSMAPGYAFGGGGQSAVTGSQTVTFPTNLNVIEQVFNDDTAIADPRLAIDIFYNCTTPRNQKEFYIVYGDSHGTPAQVANHFLPNTGSGVTSTGLQAWAICRHIDALAAYTFTGNATAQQIALGGGVTEETYVGVWSDNVPVTPMGVTDTPTPCAFSSGPYTVQWNDIANPRQNFVPVPAAAVQMFSVNAPSGQVWMAVSGLLSGCTYQVQTITNLTGGNWSNVTSFSAAQSTRSVTNAIANPDRQFWRLDFAP